VLAVPFPLELGEALLGVVDGYQTLPHHELPFIKVHSPFCWNLKTHAAVLSPKKSGGFEINGV
jgi:hypothetical protein